MYNTLAAWCLWLLIVCSNGNVANGLLRPGVVLKHCLRSSSALKGAESLTRLHVQLSPLTQDLLASTLAVGGTVAWLQIWITLAKNKVIESNLSRKIIHSGSAPLFMCLWPLFSSTPQARFFAAGVVALQMTRLVVAGNLKTQQPPPSQQPDGGKADGNRIQSVNFLSSSSTELVNAISRTGAKAEALGGPLVYTVILLLGTALFFRESPVGIVAIIQMAAGDGMADIVGRRYGRDNKWFFSQKKSYAGSAGFVVSAFSVTCAVMALFHATGFLSVDVAVQWPTVLLISVLCAIVEVLPLGEDNISVPLAGAVLAAALL